jgi:hypothetical protein
MQMKALRTRLVVSYNLVPYNDLLWGYFGFLDKKVPKCYLLETDF